MLHIMVSSGKVCDSIEPDEWMRAEIRHITNGWVVQCVQELMADDGPTRSGYMYTITETHAASFKEAMDIVEEYYSEYTLVP